MRFAFLVCKAFLNNSFSTMGALEELSKAEQKAFDELKARIANDLNEEMKKDTNLFIRFLRARDFNVDLAEAMLRNHLTWRKTFQVDSILTSYVPDEVPVKYIPIARMGFDKDGCPVIYFAFGNMDGKGILKCVTKNSCVKSVVKLFEEDLVAMKNQSIKLGKPIEHWSYILNFEDYNFSKATHKGTIEALISLFVIYESNYPERLKGAYIINASIYFNMIFQIIKPLLSGTTLKKVRIYGKDGWQEDVSKLMHPQDLPAFLGGKKTDPDGNKMCNTIVKHGAIVPSEYYQTKNTISLKHQPDVKKLNVSRMSKTHLPFIVSEKGSFIEWEFETESRDIEFGVFYAESDKNNAEIVEVVPKQRIETHLNSEVGVFQCDKAGIYTLTFDNSYSWIFQKEIYYRAAVIHPKAKTMTQN
ncbi:hypothetical protein JTE90_028949 [Oedothorax gibbosus]|uniref:SEC14-like protein 2 n=1 Tax=Oedothorax gibbosus TaxID=931172 RepID=A0AAV6VGS1_9ARAC|nr:hypothetical protein JTE90_028949 [Oedothorax gibbosus]